MVRVPGIGTFDPKGERRYGSLARGSDIGVKVLGNREGHYGQRDRASRGVEAQRDTWSMEPDLELSDGRQEMSLMRAVQGQG